jgi:hypothetical protein
VSPGVAQAHAPEMQDMPAPQRLPQPPQLFGSFAAVAQYRVRPAAPVHAMSPGFEHTHWPAWHVEFWPHAKPHAPQLAPSVCRLTHALPHWVGVPLGHWPHWPLMHAWPVAHWRPQVPQLLVSLERSAQPLAQVTWVPGHLHVPWSQTAPGLQAWPQVPQLPVSVMRSAQVLVLVHSVLAAGQAHWPLMQLPFFAHAVVQLPQCCTSFELSTHAAPQVMSPVPQAHTPWVHTCSALHWWPQAPQLSASAVRSTHTPLHSD